MDWSFQAGVEGSFPVRISFVRTDRKLQGFLRSTEPEAEFRVECSACDLSGMVPIVRNPLGDLDPTHRGLYFYHNHQTPLGLKEGEALLLRVAANKATRGVDMEGYPRAEVAVTTDS